MLRSAVTFITLCLLSACVGTGVSLERPVGKEQAPKFFRSGGDKSLVVIGVQNLNLRHYRMTWTALGSLGVEVDPLPRHIRLPVKTVPAPPEAAVEFTIAPAAASSWSPPSDKERRAFRYIAATVDPGVYALTLVFASQRGKLRIGSSLPSDLDISCVRKIQNRWANVPILDAPAQFEARPGEVTYLGDVELFANMIHCSPSREAKAKLKMYFRPGKPERAEEWLSERHPQSVGRVRHQPITTVLEYKLEKLI